MPIATADPPQRLILLITNRDDLTADWLILELRNRRVPFLRFNTEDFPTHVDFSWSLDRAALRITGRDLAAEDVTAVWWRRPVAPNLASDRTWAEAEWAVGEAAAALEGFWRSLDAHWVNWPDANAVADCKPEQLARARRLGFDVPETLITNDPERLREFAAAHPLVVCKSLREPRVPMGAEETHFYTSALKPYELDDLDDFGPEPYLFQELVLKRHDVRVTVIGETAYGCRIASQDIDLAAVDWRRGEISDLVHTPEPLPADIAERCVALTHDYQLRFSAIDLAMKPDGGYTFFELNPNGQWAWIEQLTDLPLRSRLADELTVRRR